MTTRVAPPPDGSTARWVRRQKPSSWGTSMRGVRSWSAGPYFSTGRLWVGARAPSKTSTQTAARKSRWAASHSGPTSLFTIDSEALHCLHLDEHGVGDAQDFGRWVLLKKDESFEFDSYDIDDGGLPWPEQCGMPTYRTGGRGWVGGWVSVYVCGRAAASMSKIFPVGLGEPTRFS